MCHIGTFRLIAAVLLDTLSLWPARNAFLRYAKVI
jgi:hypothetical protein